MSYNISNKQVYWKGKLIETADANRFTILVSAEFASDGSTIFFKGKALPVDRGSFVILNKGYARDKNSVYEILTSKLKVIKQADAHTFEVLSSTYAKDHRYAYFRGKRITKCDRDSLRVLHPVFAVDATRYYFTNSPFDAPEGEIDYRHAEVRVYGQYNEINCPAAVLTDGVSVYYSPWLEKQWFPTLGADPKSFAFFNGSNCYQCDDKHIYFRGKPLQGIDPATAELLGDALIKSDSGLWCGLTRVDQPCRALRIGLKEGEHVPFEACLSRSIIFTGDYYRDDFGIWSIECPRVPDKDPAPIIHLLQEIQNTHTAMDDLLFLVYHKIFAHLGSIFRQMPLALDYDELPQPLDDIPEFSLRRVGRDVDVIIEDRCVASGQISSWLSHGSAFWAHVYGRRDSLMVYPRVGVVAPQADELHLSVAANIPKELVELAGALFEEGEDEEARLLAHVILYKAQEVCQRVSEVVSKSVLLACVPAQLASEANYEERSASFEKTTHLAAAKHVVQSGLIDDADFRVRYEMLNFLHARLADTDNPKKFFLKIVPELLKRVDDEPIRFLQELMLSVIEVALVQAFVQSEVNALHSYDLIEPFIRCQIKYRVNIDLNRARLVEALWAQERDVDAEKEREALLMDCDDTWLAPPVYSHRIYWRNYRLWLMSGKIRAAWRDLKNETVMRTRLTRLEEELEDMYHYFGSPEGWGDFGSLRHDLKELRNTFVKEQRGDGLPISEAYQLHLQRYGLIPHVEDLPAIREVFDQQMTAYDGEEDEELFEVCWVQLFSAGEDEDVFRFLRCQEKYYWPGFHYEFLAGPGVERTLQLLKNSKDPFIKKEYKQFKKYVSGDVFSRNKFLAHYAERWHVSL